MTRKRFTKSWGYKLQMLVVYYIVAAFILDLIIGDPRWAPHPVRFLGNLIAKAEKICRKLFSSERVAGFMAFSLVMVIGLGVNFILLKLAFYINPWVGHVIAVLMIYFCIATKDLAKHALDVYYALKSARLKKARCKVGMIVGRETAELDEAGVTRACVESVAESIVDGIAAPLFYAVLFGPLGAVACRCTNTMDSMCGYKNEKYLSFGTVAAKTDDLVNFIPARIAGLFICLVAPICSGSFKNALKILKRDAGNHSSPNSGFPESAMAGAIGVQLGGPGIYSGKIIEKPTIGDPKKPLRQEHIRQAVQIMYSAVISFLIVALTIRTVFCILLIYGN